MGCCRPKLIGRPEQQYLQRDRRSTTVSVTNVIDLAPFEMSLVAASVAPHPAWTARFSPSGRSADRCSSVVLVEDGDARISSRTVMAPLMRIKVSRSEGNCVSSCRTASGPSRTRFSTLSIALLLVDASAPSRGVDRTIELHEFKFIREAPDQGNHVLLTQGHQDSTSEVGQSLCTSDCFRKNYRESGSWEKTYHSLEAVAESFYQGTAGIPLRSKFHVFKACFVGYIKC